MNSNGMRQVENMTFPGSGLGGVCNELFKLYFVAFYGVAMRISLG